MSITFQNLDWYIHNTPVRDEGSGFIGHTPIEVGIYHKGDIFCFDMLYIFDKNGSWLYIVYFDHDGTIRIDDSAPTAKPKCNIVRRDSVVNSIIPKEYLDLTTWEENPAILNPSITLAVASDIPASEKIGHKMIYTHYITFNRPISMKEFESFCLGRSWPINTPSFITRIDQNGNRIDIGSNPYAEFKRLSELMWKYMLVMED